MWVCADSLGYDISSFDNGENRSLLNRRWLLKTWERGKNQVA